jgi:hypothetical protein
LNRVVNVLTLKKAIMKKLVFVFLSALLIHPCFSQVQKGDSILSDLGVFAGPGLSTVMGGESWKGMFGFVVGADTKVYKFNPNSAITAGIGFAFQGAAWEEDYSGYNFNTFSSMEKSGMSTTSSISGKVSLVYLFIPILYHHVFNNNLYAEAGLQPGFLLSAKDKYDGESYDYKDHVKTFDLGIPVGVGYQLNEKLSLGARATFGVLDINKEESDTSDRNFMLVAVVRYTFGKSTVK